jgi:hypothetical protein
MGQMLANLSDAVLSVQQGVQSLLLTPTVISGHTTLLEANIDALARFECRMGACVGVGMCE